MLSPRVETPQMLQIAGRSQRGSTSHPAPAPAPSTESRARGISLGYSEPGGLCCALTMSVRIQVTFTALQLLLQVYFSLLHALDALGEMPYEALRMPNESQKVGRSLGKPDPHLRCLH